MIEMFIDEVRLSEVHEEWAVILKEKAAQRYLPIWISPAEANAIVITLQGASQPRPSTHDLLFSIINALGATLDSVVVFDLENHTFYTRMILNVGHKRTEVDASPGDALALAVNSRCPHLC